MCWIESVFASRVILSLPPLGSVLKNDPDFPFQGAFVILRVRFFLFLQGCYLSSQCWWWDPAWDTPGCLASTFPFYVPWFPTPVAGNLVLFGLGTPSREFPTFRHCVTRLFTLGTLFLCLSSSQFVYGLSLGLGPDRLSGYTGQWVLTHLNKRSWSNDS